MRRVSRRRNGVLALVLVLTLVDPVLAAVLNKRARLREGPSRFTTLVDWIDAGAPVEILGSDSGWYQVLLPDGRRGYVWGEHVDGGDLEPAADPGGADPGGADAPTPARSLQDEIRDLRAELARLTQEGALVRRADLEAVAERLERLHETQRELGALIEASAPSVATPVDGTAVAAGVFLAVGAILGWMASRVGQARRERRGRLRL